MKHQHIISMLSAGVCLLTFGLHEGAHTLPAAANDAPRVIVSTASADADDQLRLDRPPYKLSYSVYEDLDLDGATISGCGFDHEPLSDHMDMVDISEFKHKQGKYQITVHGETNDVEFFVYVRNPDSTSNCLYYIELASEPDKVIYQVGEELDLTGAVLNICGDHDKLTDHMDMVDAWDFDNTKPGEYCIKIYDYMIGRECEFYVTVVDSTAAKTAAAETTTTTTTTMGTYVEYEHLYIKQPPVKTLYQVGEILDLTGGSFEGNGHITGGTDLYYDWFDARMSECPSMIDDSQFDNTQPGVCRVYLCGRKAKTFFEVQVIPKITDQSGDANGDGSRTIGDAILMARVLAEDTAAVLSDQGKQRADLDGVNALTANDLTLILQILAGMIG